MGGVTYIDDAYLFELDDVSLSVTPASKTNSQEHGGIQIGGRDRCISSLSGVLSKTRGKLRFKIYFRHDAADCMKFKTVSYPYIFQCQGSGANYFYLRWTAANTMQLLYNDGGGNHSDNWPASGEVVADTEYLFEIVYIPNRFVLKVDGVEKAVITEPVDFASIPYQFYAGSNSNYAFQSDVVILAP